MQRKRFRITVEEAPRLDFGLTLNIPEAPNDYPPDCIVEDCDLILVKVGQLLDGTLNHYRYRRASIELYDWMEHEEGADAPEVPDDTPSLDDSFHRGEMDI